MHADPSVSSGDAAAQTASGTEAIKASELSRAIIEALAGSPGTEVRLDQLKSKVAQALDEPLLGYFQEQLDVLLTNEYVQRDPSSGAYGLTPTGQWLVQGIEVVQG